MRQLPVVARLRAGSRWGRLGPCQLAIRPGILLIFFCRCCFVRVLTLGLFVVFPSDFGKFENEFLFGWDVEWWVAIVAFETPHSHCLLHRFMYRSDLIGADIGVRHNCHRL